MRERRTKQSFIINIIWKLKINYFTILEIITVQKQRDIHRNAAEGVPHLYADFGGRGLSISCIRIGKFMQMFDLYSAFVALYLTSF